MPKITSPANTPVLNRRTVFMGAGAIGAVGAVAVASTASKVLAPPAVVAEVDPPNTGGSRRFHPPNDPPALPVRPPCTRSETSEVRVFGVARRRLESGGEILPFPRPRFATLRGVA